MRAINLASGSSGNLTYIETEQTRILVDDGVSCKETENRLALLKVAGADIDAVIVTHEHVDHIRGLDVFCKKHNVPIYAHHEVWATMSDKLARVPQHCRKSFDGTFQLKDLTVQPVEVSHDVKCFGYSFLEGDKKISILTDLGCTNDNIFNCVKESALVFLEANHDVAMLKNNPRYPLATKMRILGRHGHLSNEASAQFAKDLIESGTRQLVLCHLSQENNSPQLAFSYISNFLAEHGLIEGESFKIDVALTHPTTLFRIK